MYQFANVLPMSIHAALTQKVLQAGKLEQKVASGGNRPGGEGGNGPPERKFMKLGGMVNFWVLSSKMNVIGAKRGTISLFLTNQISFSF